MVENALRAGILLVLLIHVLRLLKLLYWRLLSLAHDCRKGDCDDRRLWRTTRAADRYAEGARDIMRAVEGVRDGGDAAAV